MNNLESSSSLKSAEIQQYARDSLGDLKLKIKYIPKDNQKYKSIILETYRQNKQQLYSKVIRQVNEFDTIIQHIQQKYGKHIIPCFNLDMLYDKKIPINKLLMEIQDYLNDLIDNQHCKSDSELEKFIFQQSANFPQKRTYDRILKKANNFSRNYLNSMFTRKSLVEMPNIDEYVRSYQQLSEKVAYFMSYREIFKIKINQFVCYQELVTGFAQLGRISCSIFQPFQQTNKKMNKKIHKCDKIIMQCQQAHLRWQNLVDTVRQLQAEVYKGIQQNQQVYKQKTETLNQWTCVLTNQYDGMSIFLKQSIEEIIEVISKTTLKNISESLLGLSSEQELSGDSLRYVKQIQNIDAEKV